jgi:hypothetical protein
MRILRERYADVWVECGEQGSDKGNDASTTTTPGALVVSGGAVENVNVGGNGYNGKRVCGRQDGYNGECRYTGTYFVSSEPRFRRS